MSAADRDARPDPEAVRARVRRSYGRFHESLAESPHGRFARFMNYGYADLPAETGGDPAADVAADTFTVRVPARIPNARAARLVAEVVGAEPLDGRIVVDVGCGRGGALALVGASSTPRAALGVDLVIGGAGSLPSLPGTTFAGADAEHLPLADGSVDVVLNIESSLHYPCRPCFFAEVGRVLRPGGAFLHTDLWPTPHVDATIEALVAAGFDVDHHRDITGNVLAARAERAEREALALGTLSDDGAGRFVGTEGTAFQAGLADGTWSYRLVRLRRSDRPAVPPSDTVMAALADATTAAHDATGELG